MSAGVLQLAKRHRRVVGYLDLAAGVAALDDAAAGMQLVRRSDTREKRL